MFNVEVFSPIFLVVSSTFFFIFDCIFSTTLYSSYSYIIVVRLIALCFAIIATFTTHPRVRTVRRRFLKLLLYSLFAFYIFSYVFIGIVWIFTSVIDDITFIDILFGPFNLSAFFIVATRVKGYEEEHTPILDYPNFPEVSYVYEEKV